MYDIIFWFNFLFIKCSVVNKIVEDHVDNLLSKNLVKIRVDQSPWGKDLIVFLRRKLENLLLVIAVNSYNATYVTSKHVQIKWFFMTKIEVKNGQYCLWNWSGWGIL